MSLLVAIKALKTSHASRLVSCLRAYLNSLGKHANRGRLFAHTKIGPPGHTIAQKHVRPVDAWNQS
jgi:hypothetical protein